MSFSEERRETIIRYMLEKIRQNDEKYAKKTADHFSISITSVKRYVKKCLAEGLLEESGKTKTGYCLPVITHVFSYIREERLSEDRIYASDIRPLLGGVSAQAEKIWYYAFTEMMNNAIEHSEASQIICRVSQDPLYTRIEIRDDGVGAFRKIRDYLNSTSTPGADFDDVRLELYKGRFTTNREAHSGEGIFFVSKAVSSFTLISGAEAFFSGYFRRNKTLHSRLIAYYTALQKIGTSVVMELENHTERDLNRVFDTYSSVDEGFTKTTIPILDVCSYSYPVARSQARRILARLEEFKTVELDFEGVEEIGQGFADEMFRVFPNRYPGTELVPINASETVMRMVKHVRRGKTA